MKIKLLIINGWSMPASIWSTFLDDISENFQSTVIDMDQCLSLVGWNELIDSYVDAKTLIIGWSLGGALAINYASKSTKKFIGLVTLQTNPCFVAHLDWPHGMDLSEFELFYGLSRKTQQAELVKRFSHLMLVGGDFYKADRRLLKEINRVELLPTTEVLHSGLDLLKTLDLRQSLSSVSVPCTHLYGQKDSLVPFKVAAAVERLATMQQVKVVAGMGHLPCLAYQDEIKKCVFEMVKHCER